MDGEPESLEGSIQLDFDLARVELAQARRACETECTESTRRHLGECRARVDRILDMWNDVLPTSA
jgi:hypothetical protein